MVIGGMPILANGPWRRVIFWLAASILRTSPWLMLVLVCAASWPLWPLCSSLACTLNAKLPSRQAISSCFMVLLLNSGATRPPCSFIDPQELRCRYFPGQHKLTWAQRYLSVRHNKHFADHSRLVVTGNHASEVEITSTVEGPDHLATLTWTDMGHIGLVMLHPGELNHHRRVRIQIHLSAQDELMQQFALVTVHKADGLTLLNRQLVGAKAHLVAHTYFDGAADLLKVTGNTPGFLFFDYGGAELRSVLFAMGQR